MKAQRKKKEAKKKERGRPVDTAAAVEIKKVAYGDFSLTDFHRCLEKAYANNAPAFPQFPQAQLLPTINHDHCPFAVSHRWGSLHLVPSL